MESIGLALQIALELARPVWPALLGAVLVWAALCVGALARRGLRWRGALAPALAVGAAVAVLVFVLLPGATSSSLAELRYWVDWASLAGIAAGVGFVAFALAAPLAALLRGAR